MEVNGRLQPSATLLPASHRPEADFESKSVSSREVMTNLRNRRGSKTGIKHVVRIRREEKSTKLSKMSETRLTAGQPRNRCSITGRRNGFKNLSVLQKIPDRL